MCARAAVLLIFNPYYTYQSPSEREKVASGSCQICLLKSGGVDHGWQGGGRMPLALEPFYGCPHCERGTNSYAHGRAFAQLSGEFKEISQKRVKLATQTFGIPSLHDYFHDLEYFRFAINFVIVTLSALCTPRACLRSATGRERRNAKANRRCAFPPQESVRRATLSYC